MSKACYKINHGNFYPESDCPYCEIDRLNKEINRLRQYEDAITSAIDGTLLVWNLMSTNHTVIKNDYWQNHLEEIERLKAELELSNDETMQESNKVVDLERQLAEARAEVERFKYMAQQNSTEMCEWMEKYNKLVVPIECYNQMLNDEIMEHKQELTKARQEAVREVLEWAAGPESYDEWVAMVKERFGLEG